MFFFPSKCYTHWHSKLIIHKIEKKNISTKPCGCNYSSCWGRTNGNPYMHIFLGSWSYTHNFYYIELTLSFAWMTQFITSIFINDVMVSQLFFSCTINISIFPIIICFLLHERISRFICMDIYPQLQEKIISHPWPLRAINTHTKPARS